MAAGASRRNQIWDLAEKLPKSSNIKIPPKRTWRTPGLKTTGSSLSLSHPLWCQINNTFLNHEIMWWHHYNVQHTPMAKFVLTNLKASKKRVTDHIEFVQRFVAWELPPARSWDNLSCDSRGSSSALMNSVHWIWMLRSGREPRGAKKPCKPIQWTFMSCHQTVGIISIMYHSARRCAKIWFVASLPRSCWSAKNLCCSCSLFACW